ncbi:OmpA family protein [Idiomarina seosinensis]|uniref:OprF n=1 Tax=Idiomarina seosinensis TaxID=281739 RepID=A0A432Z4H5_9GAMM|nr:OmpA family protein [Idiomarina seosinensis]RUO72765.1 OprF [Idiomarina seosinensis]
MKKLNTVLLALVSVGMTSVAMAQQSEKEPGEFYIGARLGALSLDSDRVGYKEGTLYPADSGFNTLDTGLEVGFMLTEYWETRIYYDYVQAGIDGAPGDLYGQSFGSDFLYHFNDMVYAGIGVNGTEVGDLSDAMVRATVGHREFINDDLSWRVEGGVQRGWELDHTEFFANIGLQLWFGEPTAVAPKQRPQVAPQPAQPAEPEPEPVDSDGDGVVDSKDNCVNTPMNYSVDANGCVKYKDETIREELLVEFDLNSSKVRESAMGEIEEMAMFMKDHPQLELTVHGHTDSTGEADYNQWLSERRAQSVADALVKRFGIAKNRVSYKGHGESQLKVKENSAADRQENRRIEAELKVVNRVPVKR